MNIISVRGATTADNNTVEAITIATVELFNEILKQNVIQVENIINIQLSITKDLNAINPAKILRENFDLAITPLFCTQEADIVDSLPNSIRIMVLVNSDLSKNNAKHVYLKNAKRLRPDLVD